MNRAVIAARITGRLYQPGVKQNASRRRFSSTRLRSLLIGTEQSCTQFHLHFDPNGLLDLAFAKDFKLPGSENSARAAGAIPVKGGLLRGEALGVRSGETGNIGILLINIPAGEEEFGALLIHDDHEFGSRAPPVPG